MKTPPEKLSFGERAELLQTLQTRFEENLRRHPESDWTRVKNQLEANPAKLWTLNEMEKTGGEPDVAAVATGEVVFVDCSPESPVARRSVCYDRAGWESRKTNRPKTSAMDMAVEMGIELLTEEEYVTLQRLGDFDLKTSSWVKTPEAMRKQGGALYAEKRYGRVFLGHNGAQSYYGIRGFRGAVRV